MGFTSDILHSNRKGKVRHGSVHKPVHHSVSFSFDDARELAYVFQGKKVVIPTEGRSIQLSLLYKRR